MLRDHSVQTKGRSFSAILTDRQTSSSDSVGNGSDPGQLWLVDGKVRRARSNASLLVEQLQVVGLRHLCRLRDRRRGGSAGNDAPRSRWAGEGLGQQTSCWGDAVERHF